MQKPTLEQVRVVITTTLSDTDLQAVIDDAALIAEGCPSVAGYSGDRQAAIVKWIAAHLIGTQSGVAGALVQKKLGDAQEGYAAPTMGLNLQGSRYGQQALLLDPSGCLANLGKIRARFQAL